MLLRSIFIFLFCLRPALAEECKGLYLPGSSSSLLLATPFGNYKGKIVRANGWFLDKERKKKVKVIIPPDGIIMEGGVNPFFDGIVETMLKKEIVFESSEIQEGDSRDHLISGYLYFGGRPFKITFPVKEVVNSSKETTVTASLKSRNLEEETGIPASAEGRLNLNFRPGQEKCT